MALLDGGGQDPAHPLCLPFPFEWNEFRVQSAVLFNGTRARPESLAPLRQCLLLHRAGALLLRAAAAQQLAPLAALGGRIAAAARPDLGAVRAELARLLAEHGAADEALGHLDAALETDPFLTEAWPLYARLLLELRGEAPACDFIERALTVLSAVAPARERWAASGSVMEMDAVREALKGMVRQLALAA